MAAKAMLDIVLDTVVAYTQDRRAHNTGRSGERWVGDVV